MRFLALFGTTAKIIFIISCLIAIGWIVFRIKRKSKGTSKLRLDPVGLWRYHTNTQFERKKSYGLTRDEEKLSQSQKKEEKERKPVAVLEFVGDIRARQHKSFAALVDELVVNKEKISEVVVVITSPGGMVAQYGHAFSQMERLRAITDKLTVCIDVVAASGGYLMSLPAHKIIAAPFATVGSVGVVAFVPNARKLLENLNIKPRTFTAGSFKRTVGLFDDASPDEIDHFQSQLETVHHYFLEVVKKYRPEVKMDEIETGSHWSAQESIEKELGLVDQVGCSEDYLIKLNEKEDLLLISHKSSFLEQGFLGFTGMLAERVIQRMQGY